MTEPFDNEARRHINECIENATILQRLLTNEVSKAEATARMSGISINLYDIIKENWLTHAIQSGNFELL